MNDIEKKENLANARRKLKKFRDQQPNGYPTIESNISPNHFLNESATDFENPLPSTKQLNTSDRNDEEKVRRDIEHLQEQLEVHVQTIGVLVAEKSDLSAKLSQSFKQLERKQSELDELYGRLKASRERVQELEKQMQNSTSDVQKRELAVKESDKENDRLKLENIRQSQLIEDLKENINQLNEKLRNQEQHEKSLDEKQISINRLRSDNEQYQQTNIDMQHHIKELNDQINQMQNEFQHEKELFQNAIDQWANRYEDLKSKLDQNNSNQDPTDFATENIQLKEKIQQLEQTISELQAETDSIGDYIQLYQQQREQLQKRYQEKDQLIEQLTSDRDHLQKQLSSVLNGKFDSVPQLSTELQQQTSQSQPIKLAFNDNNYFLCSTCTGSLQWV